MHDNMKGKKNIGSYEIIHCEINDSNFIVSSDIKRQRGHII